MDTTNFTFDEMNLMYIYNTGSRRGLISELREMRGYLETDETEFAPSPILRFPSWRP